MNCWQILGIEKTDDMHMVKKAYARKSKIYHPETHPEEFQQLHNAYKEALAIIRKGEVSQNKSIEADINQPDSKGQKEFTDGLEKADDRKKTVLSDEMQKADILKKTEDTKENGKPADNHIKDETFQNEEFLQQIEQEAERRDLSVNKPPEMILFEKMLRDELPDKQWNTFILSDFFLDNQYEESVIHAMATMIKERLLYVSRHPGEYFSRLTIIYIMIAYGCIFDTINDQKIVEKVYKKEQLEELADAFQSDNIFERLRILESDPKYLGEKYAFYVYRNILELLEQDEPDKDKIKDWLLDGFQKQTAAHLLEIAHHNPQNTYWKATSSCRLQSMIKRSPIIFELMSHLAGSQNKNVEIFREILYKVCQMDMGDYAGEEKSILMLQIEELTDITGWKIPQKEKINNDYQEMPEKNVYTIEKENDLTQKKNITGVKIVSELLTCNGRTFTFFFLLMISGVMLVLPISGVFALAKAGDVEGFLCMLFMLFMFGSLTAVLIAIIKNYSLTFTTEGVIYRTIVGKVYTYTYEQIEYYTIVNYALKSSGNYFKLHTRDRNITFNSCCSNFFEACELLRKSSIKSR